MFRLFSLKNINRLAINQRPLECIRRANSSFISKEISQNNFLARTQPTYPFHCFKSFYTFSAAKPQPPKDNQQQQQQKSNIQQQGTSQAGQSQKEDDQKAKELELIFSKQKRQKQEEKFDPEQKLAEFEKKVKNTNLNVIKRELFNDSMQLPIKFLAYNFAGHASVGTFLAELCRSTIDAVNHLVLYFANYIDVKPSKRYPQGLENIKQLIVLIPSSLFVSFGVYTIYSAFTEYLAAGPAVVAQTDNIYSILLYLASFCIEISVIAYNIRDSMKMQNINSTQQTNQKLSLFQIMKTLVAKKDPLLQAILYENMITLMSMSVPLMVGISNMIIPSNLPEFIGQIVIGSIQLLLGQRLFKEVASTILGKSVDEETMNDIHNEIMKNPYVKSVRDEKGIMSGSVRFKYYAIVEYDFEQLNEDAMEDYRQMSDYIIYSQDYKDRQEELEELMESFPIRLLKEVKRQEQLILESIKIKYPQCDYLDLNIDTDKLYQFLDDEEKIKNSFHQEISSEDEEKEETENDKLIREWIITTSQQMLEKKFTKQKEIIVKTKDQQFYENLHFKINPKHYSNNIHRIFIQEKALVHEQQRAQIIEQDLNFDDCYKNNEDPL
ncbi:hypothetical protein ABPG74_014966 [Tetrahymena malaccensis]